MVDVQALAGDSTDNVPGAPGIGLKTAAQLITEYGDLETLLARAGEIKQPKRREALTNPDTVKLIRVSKQLVTLDRDVPVETPLEVLATPELDGKRLISLLQGDGAHDAHAAASPRSAASTWPRSNRTRASSVPRRGRAAKAWRFWNEKATRRRQARPLLGGARSRAPRAQGRPAGDRSR